MMIKEAPNDITRERAEDMQTALRRLTRLTEELMQLARSESGRLVAERPVNIATILRMVVSELDGQAFGSGRIEPVMPSNRCLRDIDKEAIAILARNLIENALKHGAPDMPVRVFLSGEGVLRIINAGPVVPSEVLSRLKRAL